MGLRVLLMMGISFAGIVLSFFSAFYGLLAYAFWSYVNPSLFVWGAFPFPGLGFFVGTVLVLATLLQKRTLFAPHPRSFLIMFFWLLCFVSAFFSPENKVGWWQFKYFSRVILVTLIMPVLITDIKKFRYYLWAMALFIGLFAAYSGLRGIVGGGQTGSGSYGFQGVISEERNMTGAYLCVMLPILFYMAKGEMNKWLKRLLIVVFVGDICAVILTYSRGAFLGLAAVILFMIMRTRRKALLIIPAILLAVLAASFFLPEAYKERLLSIKKHDITEKGADLSAAGRVIVWRSTLEMIKENPFGVGFYNAVNLVGNYPDPKTGVSLPGKAIHNSLLQVTAETGIQGFIVYFIIFAQAFFAMGRLKRLTTKHKLDPRLFEYASIFQAVFVGFFVTSFFVNMAFMDLSWHLVALGIALERIAKKELSLQRAVEQEAG